MKGKTKKTLQESDVKEILIKKALGYDATEIIEEYGEDKNGEIKLVKKKITTKSVPPDISALKMLLEDQAVDYGAMTDIELEQEKTRLLQLLCASEENLKEKKGAKQKKQKTI